MFALRKISLTLSAAVFIGGYSLVRAVIKRIRAKNPISPQYTSDGVWSVLPLEIQELILNEALSILTNKQLLDLTLTCKRFYSYISYSNIWTKRAAPTIFDPPTIELDEGCSHTGFPPKINYFFKQKRLIRLGGSIIGPRDTQYMTYGYHSADLYVPWLTNDFIKQPATFWKFVRTIIVDPESLFKFLVQEDIFSSRAAVHRPSVKRLGTHLKILTIVFSILPWIDLFLAKSPFISAVTSATSPKNYFELIWNYEPMAITDMVHMSMTLFFSQLLNNVFYYSDLLPYQAALAIIQLFFDRGLKTALGIMATSILPVILYMRVPIFQKVSATKYWWIPILLIAASLVYFNPIMTIYMFLGVFTIVWDMAQRALRPKQFKMRSAKWFLLGSTAISILAIVVTLRK